MTRQRVAVTCSLLNRSKVSSNNAKQVQDSKPQWKNYRIMKIELFTAMPL